MSRRVLFGLVCVLGVAMPAAAQGVGAIGGTVMDNSGGILPGVTVTLSSPGLIGGRQTAITDARGTYQFTRLVPGRYSVRAELQGFQAVVQENIDVNADRTSRADLTLAVGAVEETVTVAGLAPLLDTTSTLNLTVMTRDVLDQVPTPNDLWSIARLSPALHLSKIDVGGKEMIAQSDAYVHGSIDSENSYLIDGMDINAYSSGTGGSLNFYVDSFSAQEVNYQAGQTPAEQAVGGVIMNVITKTGANAFRGAAMFSGTNQRLQSDNLTPALRQQLLAGVPAAALAANPNIVPGGEIKLLYDTAITWSGPVREDKLWFVASAKLGESDQYKVGSYNTDGTQLLSDNNLRNLMAKGSWRVTRDSQLHYTWLWVHKGRYHVAGGPTVTQFFDTAASLYNPSRNHVHIARWTSVLSSQMVVDVAMSAVEGQTNTLPQPGIVRVGDIARFDSVARTNTVASPTYTINAGLRSNFATSLTYVTGKHDLKVGYQFFRTRRDGGGFSVSHYPAGLRTVYRSGVPDSVNTYNTPTEYYAYHKDQAVFLQDKWRPLQRLTLNLGVRFETTYGWLDEPLCQAGTPFIEAQCFPAVKGAPDWKSVVPRVSGIYDLMGNGRTALKFTANRYRIPQGITFAERLNPIRITNDTRPWTDANGDRIPQLTELGPSTGFNLGTTNRYADGVTWPYVDEIGTEIQQELPGQIVVTAGYYYRGRRDQIGSTNVAVPRESYTPLEVTEVASGRRVTVYNQNAATRGRFDVVWSNQPEADSSFHGVDLTFQKRMSNRWMLMGSLSLGKTEVDIQGTADRNNPNFDAFRRGVDSNDRPVFVKVAGVYELPYGVSVGASGQYYTGWPDTTTVLVNANTVRLTQVNQTLVVEPRGATRLPDITVLDFNVRKVFRQGAVRIEPRMDVFNLFNAAAVTQWITQLGPSHRNAIEILGGRLVKFGVNVGW